LEALNGARLLLPSWGIRRSVESWNEVEQCEVHYKGDGVCYRDDEEEANDLVGSHGTQFHQLAVHSFDKAVFELDGY
jgi:hypothetical protein